MPRAAVENFDWPPALALGCTSGWAAGLAFEPASGREKSGHRGRIFSTRPFGPTPTGCRAPPRPAPAPTAVASRALSAGPTCVSRYRTHVAIRAQEAPSVQAWPHRTSRCHPRPSQPRRCWCKGGCMHHGGLGSPIHWTAISDPARPQASVPGLCGATGALRRQRPMAVHPGGCWFPGKPQLHPASPQGTGIPPSVAHFRESRSR